MTAYETPRKYFEDKKRPSFRVEGIRLSPLERAIAQYVYLSPASTLGRPGNGNPRPRSYAELYQFYFEYFKDRGEKQRIVEMVDQNLNNVRSILAFVKGASREVYEARVTLQVLEKKFKGLKDKYSKETADVKEVLYSDFYPSEYGEMTSDTNLYTKSVHDVIGALKSKKVLTLTHSKYPRIKVNPKARIINGK